MNGANLIGVPAGSHRLLVDAVGQRSGAQAQIHVLDQQPFQDVQNLTCVEGPATLEGSCQLLVP